MDNKIAHLNMIQAVINRMAGNSFLLKGWSVTLVSALFALAAAKAEIIFAALAYFPVFSFWMLDAYFLWQERLFRALYDQVRGLDDTAIDFSMNTQPVSSKAGEWISAAFSLTLIIFYGAVIGSILFVTISMK